MSTQYPCSAPAGTCPHTWHYEPVCPVAARLKGAAGASRGSLGTLTSAAKVSASDPSTFRGVYAEALISGETPDAFVYAVEMESEITEQPLTVSLTKSKARVIESGEPTAAEVLATLATDARSLRQVNEQADLGGWSQKDDPEEFRARAISILGEEYGHSLDLDFENTFIDADGDLMAGPSDAEKVYDSLIQADKDLQALVGPNKEIVLEALRQEEGDSFDEQGWRYDLGLAQDSEGARENDGSPAYGFGGLGDDEIAHQTQALRQDRQRRLGATESDDDRFERQAAASYAEYQAEKDDSDIEESVFGKQWHKEQDDAFGAHMRQLEDAQADFLDKSVSSYFIEAIDRDLYAEMAEEMQATFELDDIDPASREAAEAEYRSFLEDNWATLKDLDQREVALGFYRDRNSYEQGFQDLVPGEAGQRLAESARAYGEQHAVPDSEGKVYFE